MLPGGYVDKGETAYDGLLRELKEESGVLLNEDLISILKNVSIRFKKLQICVALIMTQLPEIENMASIFNKRLNYQFPTETSNYGYYSPKNDSITYYSKGKKIRIENISKTRKIVRSNMFDNLASVGIKQT